MRVLGAAVAVACLLAVGAQEAGAALRFTPCGDEPFRCARLSVPLDRSGATPGRISLLVKRAPARAARRGAVVFLAGGPGQSATFTFDSESLGSFGKLRSQRDLIVFDQRGTGRSGLLRCPELERANIVQRPRRPAAQCAARLGARRSHYTSIDTADDLEAIRQALGVPTLSLFGGSYGTRTALTYAQRYPAHVERLALDSMVEPDGTDALEQNTFAAVPRVLRALCGTRACSRFTRDPVRDVARLTRRLDSPRPLTGRRPTASGRPRTQRLRAHDVFTALLSGDFDAQLRTPFPAAAASAVRGDAAPMLRLYARALGTEDTKAPAELLSRALYAATTCEEARLPWAPGTPVAARGAAIAAAGAALQPKAFAPFDVKTALAGDTIDLCRDWPTSPRPAPPPIALPNVPALLVEGSDDLRTPLESAQAVARLLPQAQLVTVRGTGHVPTGVAPSHCADNLVPNFFEGRRAPATCPGFKRKKTLPGPLPRRLADVRPARGTRGRAGRALRAVLLTLSDAQLDSAFLNSQRNVKHGLGLRAGRYTDRDDGRVFTALGLSLVERVRISGEIRDLDTNRARGRLRVSGSRAIAGILRIRGGRISGRLGGRAVRAVGRVATVAD